jgi:hypothetical protein
MYLLYDKDGNIKRTLKTPNKNLKKKDLLNPDENPDDYILKVLDKEPDGDLYGKRIKDNELVEKETMTITLKNAKNIKDHEWSLKGGNTTAIDIALPDGMPATTILIDCGRGRLSGRSISIKNNQTKATLNWKSVDETITTLLKFNDVKCLYKESLIKVILL